jgi:hypothetical protein
VQRNCSWNCALRPFCSVLFSHCAPTVRFALLDSPAFHAMNPLSSL